MRLFTYFSITKHFMILRNEPSVFWCHGTKFEKVYVEKEICINLCVCVCVCACVSVVTEKLFNSQTKQ